MTAQRGYSREAASKAIHGLCLVCNVTSRTVARRHGTLFSSCPTAIFHNSTLLVIYAHRWRYRTCKPTKTTPSRDSLCPTYTHCSLYTTLLSARHVDGVAACLLRRWASFNYTVDRMSALAACIV